MIIRKNKTNTSNSVLEADTQDVLVIDWNQAWNNALNARNLYSFKKSSGGIYVECPGRYTSHSGYQIFVKPEIKRDSINLVVTECPEDIDLSDARSVKDLVYLVNENNIKQTYKITNFDCDTLDEASREIVSTILWCADRSGRNFEDLKDFLDVSK